jgi:hypothetical protein
MFPPEPDEGPEGSWQLTTPLVTSSMTSLISSR